MLTLQVPSASASVAAKPLGTPTRLHFIDAARGATMLFVLVSHFGLAFFPDGDFRGIELETITMIASPTFVLVSGIVLGFLHRSRRHDFDRVATVLADRALFLLTIGHVLVVAASWPLFRTVRYLSITDVIGVSMLAAPPLIRVVAPARRLLLAVGLYLGSWLAMGLWHPTATAPTLIKEILFGSLHPTVLLHTWPVAHWFALYLAGTVLGDRLGSLSLASNRDAMGVVLARTGLCAVSAAVLLKGGQIALRSVAGADPYLLSVTRVLFSPGIKFPPSPGYFLFYGGLACCWLWLWLTVERRGIAPALFAQTIRFGQTTVFMFLLQFFIYFTLIHVLHDWLPFRSAWPVHLIGTIVLTGVLTELWHRRGYNRFITVGLRSRLARSRDSAPVTRQESPEPTW